MSRLREKPDTIGRISVYGAMYPRPREGVSTIASMMNWPDGHRVAIEIADLKRLVRLIELNPVEVSSAVGDTFIDWRHVSPRDQWIRIVGMLAKYRGIS